MSGYVDHLCRRMPRYLGSRARGHISFMTLVRPSRPSMSSRRCAPRHSAVDVRRHFVATSGPTHAIMATRSGIAVLPQSSVAVPCILSVVSPSRFSSHCALLDSASCPRCCGAAAYPMSPFETQYNGFSTLASSPVITVQPPGLSHIPAAAQLCLRSEQGAAALPTEQGWSGIHQYLHRYVHTRYNASSHR
ncbi:hypothetical protein BD413DRAFT_115761 [Trametes elegans]|nr:hypothetical protein BD413DRAFT_115761 [Trametes elegans]